MTALRIEKFMGIAPKISDRLLADSSAVTARNARLLSGELRGFREPEILHGFDGGEGSNDFPTVLPDPIKYAYRALKSDGTEVWMAFGNADVDVAKGPLVNDSYERYYWTGEEAYVAYLPIDDIVAGDAPLRLGVPGPTAAPSIAVVGGVGDIETRAYVYTFVNILGEEGAPSPVVQADGPNDASWDLSALEVTGTDMTNRADLEFKNIYRTVTGENSVQYFFVEQIALATATYSDTIANEVTVQNSILSSYAWTPPPDALVGLIAHPAGFLAGFVGRDLYFSEPYRPHAWPVQYQLSLEYDIVGLSIYSNMLVVMTQSKPYFIAGSNPLSMSPIKSPSIETCLSKGSIAATIQGVLYASPNGIVLFNESGPQIITSPIMTNEEWDDFSPATLRAAQYGMTYVGFYSSSAGFKFSPAEALALLTTIDRFDNVQNIITDVLTGKLWLIRNNKVWLWEPPDGEHLYYTWKSKQFDFTRPVNLGACMIKYKTILPSQSTDYFAAAEDYNIARMAAAPLNPFNYTMFNGTVDVDLGATPPIDPTTGMEFAQNKYPFGGSPLLLTQPVSTNVLVQLTIWADGDVVFQEYVAPNSMRRLPSGFKAHVWQFELIGNADVYSFAIAETGRELQSV